jgi:hypothetical protein
MELRLNGPLEIEDLRHHPAEQIEHLRELLSAGAPARPDPRRRYFYEIEDGTLVFYVLVPPATAKVHLLAVWRKNPAVASAPSASGL